MNDAALKSVTLDIVVDEFLPHLPETIWKTLTTAGLMGRWLMIPDGFEPLVGKQFTYRTTPAGAWDGTIECEVLELIPNERFAFRWKGGHKDNVGYGAPLDTIVTFTLEKRDGGTRLRLVHSGFSLPRNETAYRGMSGGWAGVVSRISEISGEQ